MSSDFENFEFGADVFAALNSAEKVEVLIAESPKKELTEEEKAVILERYATRFGIFQNDFSKLLFRPHAIHHLMGGLPKPLTDNQKETLAALEKKYALGKITDKQLETMVELRKKRDAKPILSTGAIKYLKELYKEKVFQRTKELKSKYLDKGLSVESESIRMVNEVFGTNYEKNEVRFENDYLTGEPDIIDKDEVIDIKSSWDFTTFPLLDDEVENQAYYYQLQCYMDLLGFDKAKLVYVLADTPDTIIQNERYKVSMELGLINSDYTYDLPEDLDFEIERNLIYDDIPKQARIIVFPVERNQKVIDQIHHQIKLAREYLTTLDKSMDKRFNSHL